MTLEEEMVKLVWVHSVKDIWNVVKGAKGTISLAQAKNAVPGPNCMLKSLWG